MLDLVQKIVEDFTVRDPHGGTYTMRRTGERTGPARVFRPVAYNRPKDAPPPSTPRCRDDDEDFKEIETTEESKHLVQVAVDSLLLD